MEQQTPETSEKSFKKPLLVGKIGKFPKRIKQIAPVSEETTEIEAPPQPQEPPEEKPVERLKDIGYEEPPWSGLPEKEYVLEVLKNGAIIDIIKLIPKPYWVFGRLNSCDVWTQHPTISRHHAVLQYRHQKTESASTGYYIYDLESTHGTFLNKNRLRPRSFVKMHVGHMLKLGCSTRTYILNGPPEDAEQESEFTVTELKQKRLEELHDREQQKIKREEYKKKQEERGVDWGLGEDAEEETDLSENPYAQTNNEDLYIDNPKKALRGFFEREGLELEYDCNEQGMGQFLCKVELPLDDEMGQPIFAEVFHKGKKKEAVVQCALEACRILDRHGVLRQATHESRKRKPKNWEENDFYDSDDDTFLDRTGTVEKKREMRMNAKAPQKAETYESLVEKEKTMLASIRDLEADLVRAQKKLEAEGASSSSDIDSLDSYMLELKQSKPSKRTINKLKSDLVKLKQEHSNVIRLVNITKPASLPPLEANYEPSCSTSEKKNVQLPIFGKRRKIKTDKPSQSEAPVKNVQSTEKDKEEEEEEDDDDEIEEKVQNKKEDASPPPQQPREVAMAEEEESPKENDEKRKRKNQRRIQQKQEKAEIQKQKGYVEDATKEDYNMWIPPNNQTGDGRTTLNDKYGY